MKRIYRNLAGGIAFAMLLAIAGIAQAQDTTAPDADQSQMPMGQGMMGQGMMGGGYCQPGCVVGPMNGQGAMMAPGMMMYPGMMMNPGMMGWGQMPMMGSGMMGQGMMNQGQMPMMGSGMMGQGMMNQGMMNQGQMPMMGGGMMDPGMMGQYQMPMMGGGMTGQGMGQYLASDLTDDDVRHVLEHRLAMTGMPNLAVGSVEEQDADTILAEVVTKDGIVVQRLSVDRHTGQMTPLE